MKSAADIGAPSGVQKLVAIMCWMARSLPSASLIFIFWSLDGGSSPPDPSPSASAEGGADGRAAAEIPRDGERYDARQRRREELVSAAWRESRADPRVATEVDGFMAAASERLGEEGMRNASRAASSGRSMTVPGVGREHQAGLEELARSFVQGRDRMALSAAWDQRVEREAKDAERQRARAEERQARGLPPEPER